MGEDPDAPNYDPNHRIIRSPYHGSEGPLRHAGSKIPLLHSLGKTTDDIEFVKAWLDHPSYGGFMHRSIIRDWERWSKGDGRPVGVDTHHLLYPTIKDLEPEWWEDPRRRQGVVEVFDKMAFDGDVPENLGATAMVTNAYLYTGEEKYRQWVLDYVDAWLDRTGKNGGIIPDNVGPNGMIGEHRNGQWWGGVKGWASERGGTASLLLSVAVGAECAHLLTGDTGYLELLRSQIDVLLARSKTEESGDLLVPMRHGFPPRAAVGETNGPAGWQEFQKTGCLRTVAPLSCVDVSQGPRYHREAARLRPSPRLERYRQPARPQERRLRVRPLPVLRRQESRLAAQDSARGAALRGRHARGDATGRPRRGDDHPRQPLASPTCRIPGRDGTTGARRPTHW